MLILFACAIGIIVGFAVDVSAGLGATLLLTAATLAARQVTRDD